MSEKNYFIGIDLGTTNSAIAWGKIDPRTNQLDTSVIDIKMIDSNKGQSKNKLLPSVVFFTENGPIVGEYAKFMYSRKPDKISKSIKSYMGSNDTFKYNGSILKPEDISKLILGHLANSAKELFGSEQKQVIITVPASFDTDMRNAAIEAAKLAGFAVKNSDGSDKTILLDEPRAALYDFINRQNKGEIPNSLIDFRENKHILVFDLGGGTLDVSFHNVIFNTKENTVDIEDIAVSRYTRIGGDDFDELLAKRFKESFLEENKIKIESDFEKNELDAKFIQFAEEAKLEISNTIYSKESLGIDSFSNVEIEVMKGNVYDNRPFEYDLNFEDYESIISPLLGNDLKIESYHEINDISNTGNIIYPILDVLDKAKNKLGELPEIDGILLNGGMTKLYSIRKRLKDFFGKDPISAGDQDLAVARGASVFHYMLTRGFEPAAILNDTIGIETEGAHVKHLVQAGVVLPHKSNVIKDFVIANDNARFIDLPFYMGRSNDTNAPNRKIGERRVHFNKPQKVGTAIEIEVSVDVRNILNVKGWVSGEPENKFEVDVIPSRRGLVSESSDTPLPTAPTKSKRCSNVEYTPSGDLLDVDTILSTLLSQYRSYSNTQPFNEVFKNATMYQIKKVEAEIIKSKNGIEFVDEIILQLKGTDVFGKSRMIKLLGDFAIKYPTVRKKVWNCCLNSLDLRNFSTINSHIVNSLIRPIINSIGKTCEPSAESILINIMQYPNVASIRQDIMISLGKIGHSTNSVQQLKKYIKSDKVSDRISCNWAFGRIGSRELENSIPISNFSGVIEMLLDQLSREDHMEALKYNIYALGEIGDRRFLTDQITPVQADKISTKINKYANNSNIQIKNRANLAIHMLSGERLSADEEKELLAIRTMLE